MTYYPPPEGWVTFGTHAAFPRTVRVEFSEELDEEGFPKWERAIDG
jgi:hypothetical protein